MKPIFTSLAILLISITISISICDARILNVPEDYQTIQAGIDSSSDGDTVLVQPGEYQENVFIRTSSITLTSRFIFDSDQETIDSTVIDGRQRESVIRVDVNEACTIRGFTIRNGQSHRGGGISVSRAGDLVLLEDLRVNDNVGTVFGGGVYTGDRVNVELNRVSFFRNRGGSGGGIFHIGASIAMNDCQMTENTGNGGEGAGMKLYGSSVSINRCLVARNQCYRFSVWIGCPIIRMDHLTIVGNTSPRDEGGLFCWSGQDNFISNSVVRGNSEPQVYVVGLENFPFTIKYCDLENGPEGVENHDNIAIFTSEIIDSDPLFLDPNNGDYRLSPNSPCIDAGDPEAPLDPDGTRADMGAYYFHQRDIEVEPLALTFRTYFGALDSMNVVVRNEGGTPLHIGCIILLNEMGFPFWHIEPQGYFDTPIEMNPDSSLNICIYFRPFDQSDPWLARVLIQSDDPDESEITIEATGEILAAPPDNFHPSLFTLHSAFPNPFNSSTTIRFSLSAQSASSAVNLRVYGLDGRLMDEMDMGNLEAGEHSVVWNAESLPAGVYVVRLEAGGDSRMIKLVLVR